MLDMFMEFFHDDLELLLYHCKLCAGIPAGSGNIFIEIAFEISSTVIPFCCQIQEGPLSVSGERMCANTS